MVKPIATPDMKARWMVMTLCFFAYFVMIIDRVNISIAAKAIMAEYDLSQIQIGGVFSAFFFSYAAFNVPGGWLADRYGPRRVLATAIFLWSLFTLLTAFAAALQSVLGIVGSLMLVRVLVGLGESAGPPSVMRIIANWMPSHERARAVGFTLSGHALGALATPLLVVWIMVKYGWRYAFILAGGVGLVLAIVWYLLVRDQPAGHSGPTARIAETPQNKGTTPWRGMLTSPDILVLMGISFVLGYAGFFFFTWFFLYLVQVRGFSIQTGGIYTAMPFLIASVAAPFGGWLSDRITRAYGARRGRSQLGLTCFLLAGLFIFAGAYAADARVAVAFFSLGAGLCFASTSVVFATTINLVPSSASVATALIMLSTNLGGAVSPSLMPFIASRSGWRAALYSSAAMLLIAACSWVFVQPERVVCPAALRDLH